VDGSVISKTYNKNTRPPATGGYRVIYSITGFDHPWGVICPPLDHLDPVLSRNRIGAVQADIARRRPHGVDSHHDTVRRAIPNDARLRSAFPWAARGDLLLVVSGLRACLDPRSSAQPADWAPESNSCRPGSVPAPAKPRAKAAAAAARGLQASSMAVLAEDACLGCLVLFHGE
jgi:hypothetical protein